MPRAKTKTTPSDLRVRTVAALYVEPTGPYAGLEGVDVWGEARDARTYAGPHPVVAHPPCTRWSVLAAINVSRGYPIGEDHGAFAAALSHVRTFGGVLEHPAKSFAWRHFGLLKPPTSGGWVNADWLGGWTCQVEQGNYGHSAPKATWLYTCKVPLLSLRWGRSFATGRVKHSENRGRGRPYKWMSDRQRLVTPEPFRDLLLSMARSVR